MQVQPHKQPLFAVYLFWETPHHHRRDASTALSRERLGSNNLQLVCYRDGMASVVAWKVFIGLLEARAGHGHASCKIGSYPFYARPQKPGVGIAGKKKE